MCKAANFLLKILLQLMFLLEEEFLKLLVTEPFDTWTVTVINDEDFRLRRAFENG
jgi:hypothetical protein